MLKRNGLRFAHPKIVIRRCSSTPVASHLTSRMSIFRADPYKIFQQAPGKCARKSACQSWRKPGEINDFVSDVLTEWLPPLEESHPELLIDTSQVCAEIQACSRLQELGGAGTWWDETAWLKKVKTHPNSFEPVGVQNLANLARDVVGA